MQHDPATLRSVKAVMVGTLGLEGRDDRIDASTPLLDALPELDSLAIVSLAASLEDHFDIVITDDEMSADVFETLGTLADMVQSHLPAAEAV